MTGSIICKGSNFICRGSRRQLVASPLWLKIIRHSMDFAYEYFRCCLHHTDIVIYPTQMSSRPNTYCTSFQSHDRYEFGSLPLRRSSLSSPEFVGIRGSPCRSNDLAPLHWLPTLNVNFIPLFCIRLRRNPQKPICIIQFRKTG